jgi:hypothetical protein
MENVISDIVKNINRAQQIQGSRTGERTNPEGDVSTHIMAQADNYIFPMLHQLFGEWNEFTDWREAADYSEQQGELYEFGDEQEAKAWGEGRWKQENLEPFINALVSKYLGK